MLYEAVQSQNNRSVMMLSDRPLPTGSIRQFKAITSECQLWVADHDLSWRTWRGFVYVAFVIDVICSPHSGLAGIANSLQTGLVLWMPWNRRCMTANRRLKMKNSSTTATEAVQYVSIRYAERIAGCRT